MATSRRLEVSLSACRSLSSLTFCAGSSRSPWQLLGLLGGCALMSSACGAAICCGLHYGFGCSLATSLLASALLAAAATAIALVSRQARCLSVLLTLACGARETRGALVSAAVLLALTQSLRNAAGNVQVLVDCFECVVKTSLQGVREFVCSVKEAVDLLYAISRDIMNALNDAFGRLTFSSIEHERSVETVVRCDASLDAIDGIRNYTESIFEKLDIIANALGHPLFNGTLVALNLLVMLISTGRYFRHYSQKLSFDNVCITSQFCRMDRELKRRGEEYVLPLLKVEREKYIFINSLTLSSVERRTMVRDAVPVITNALLCAIAIAADHGVFLLTDVVYRSMQSVAHEQVSMDMNIEVNIVVLQWIHALHRSNSFNNTLSLIGETCVDKSRLPTRPNKSTVIKVSVLFAALALFSLTSPLIHRLRRKVVSLFYPEREKERILYLHKKILDKRRKRPKGTIKLHRTILQSIMKYGKRGHVEDT